MSKSIKVSDSVYQTIQKYQEKRESYSHVIERAFNAWETIELIKRGEFTPLVRPEKLKKEER